MIAYVGWAPVLACGGHVLFWLPALIWWGALLGAGALLCLLFSRSNKSKGSKSQVDSGASAGDYHAYRSIFRNK